MSERFEFEKKRLMAMLTNSGSDKLYRYLLIDELASVNDLDYISIASLRQLLGDDRVTTLIRPNLSHDLSSCPKLITLASPDEKIDGNIIHFSLLQAKGECRERNRFICGWFVSEYSPEEITKQFILLGNKLAVQCKTTFVPIYEPFRLFLLRNSNQFCAEWHLSAFKFVTKYAYLSIENELDFFEGLGQADGDLFLDFDAQYLQQEARATFYFYMAWREIEVHLKDRISENAKTVFKSYYEAHEWQLIDIYDRSIFGLMNLRYGGGIIKNKDVALAVAAAQKEPGILTLKLKQLSFLRSED